MPSKQYSLFGGDVYTGLDADSLDTQALNFAQKHLRILSGLYGLLRPLDLMQPYRLEMGLKLPTAEARISTNFGVTILPEHSMLTSRRARLPY